jgi:hypothetical protein
MIGESWIANARGGVLGARAEAKAGSGPTGLSIPQASGDSPHQALLRRWLSQLDVGEGTLREHEAGHARPRAVIPRRGIRLSCGIFVPAASRPCPWFRPRCSMVRRGSTVRVRQRALQNPRSRGFSVQEALLFTRACGGYGAFYGAFKRVRRPPPAPSSRLTCPRSQKLAEDPGAHLRTKRSRQLAVPQKLRERAVPANSSFDDFVEHHLQPTGNDLSRLAILRAICSGRPDLSSRPREVQKVGHAPGNLADAAGSLFMHQTRSGLGRAPA